MSTTSQFFSQILISVLISVAVWVITAVALLSLPAILTGGGFLIPNAPFSQSAGYGLAAGVFHGLLTGLIISFYKPDSIIGSTLSSFLATEISIALGFIAGFAVHYLNQPTSPGNPATPPSFSDYAAFFINILLWFIIFSILFLVPSIIIGLLNKPFLPFSSTKLN